MKIKFFFLTTLLALSFISCDEENNENDEKVEKAYFSIAISFPESSNSLRAGEPTTTNENGDGYQTGLASEQKFSSVAVVIADAVSNIVTDYVTYSYNEFSPYGDSPVDQNGIGGLNTTKDYLSNKSKLVTKGNGKVYVFLNPNSDVASKFAVGQDLTSTKKEMTALTNANITVVGGIAETNKFLMGNADPAVITNINGTSDAPTIVSVTVERAAVKVVENTITSNEFTLVNDLNIGTAKATIANYQFDNRNKRSFLLKQVENRTDAGAITGNYVVDPNFIKSEYGVALTVPGPWLENDFFTKLSNSDINKAKLAAADINYMLENTMISNEQYENKSTAIIYKANMDLDSHTGTFYIYKNNVYTTYAGLQAAYNIDYPNPAQQLSTVFAEIDVTNAYAAPYNAAAVKSFNKLLIDRGIKCYYQGASYYKWVIRHWSQSDLLGRMEFGLVRNNVYYLEVTKIENYGEPWVPGGQEDPENPTDPDPTTDPTNRPDETDKASLRVEIKVLPWTVRYNNIDF